MTKAKNDTKRLYRSDTDTIIAGVAGGLAEYFAIDPTIIRLLFLASVLFGGFGIPVYFVLWVLLPRQNAGEPATEETIQKNVAEMKQKVELLTENLHSQTGKKGSRNLLALFLILLGCMIFLSKLGIFHADLLWPLLLVGVGIFLFTR